MKWIIFVRREEPGGDVFATVDDAPDAGDAIRRVKTALNGSVEAYDRDALCPELVALPGQAEQNQENASCLRPSCASRSSAPAGSAAAGEAPHK